MNLNDLLYLCTQKARQCAAFPFQVVLLKTMRFDNTLGVSWP